MNIKPLITTQTPRQTGSALLLTMIMAGVALAMLAAALSWSSSSTRLTYRSIQYTRSEAAAEAATDKAVSQISRDFLYYGEATVDNNLGTYRSLVPASSDSAYWNTWQFNDASGNPGQTYVQLTAPRSYKYIDPPYSNLQAYVSAYTIVSNAKDTASPQDLTVGVLQEIHLLTIPVFQYAMFSSENMEISCGQPFTVTGPVHANGYLYIEPDSSMKFLSEVGAVLKVRDQRDIDDGDTRTPPSGLPVAYVEPGEPESSIPALTLPIGTTNTPEGIREIIEPRRSDDTPALSRIRYNNQCDMVVTVSDGGVISATSGNFNNFLTTIPPDDLATFITITNSFYDAREGKTVQPIDLDIGALAGWSQTNSSLRISLIGSNVTSVYVLDNRTLPGTSLGAVRVVNGATLPGNGLTVATARPLYVLGDFNSDVANRGTANTTGTLPASLAADAITILSDNWTDGTTSPGGSPPNAWSTTVNAAFLTGVVETTSNPYGGYSGGMENFPRFLETWGAANIFTYNGSMVKMFPSLYATGFWGQPNVYDPPARNWAFDTNFRDPLKLPPLTPSFLEVVRQQWATLPPGQTVAP
jgi:hypothetical protein